MYKDNSQLRIEDFVFPYGKLDAEQKKPRMYRRHTRQQCLMFESGTHSIPRSIVSLAQPWASR